MGKSDLNRLMSDCSFWRAVASDGPDVHPAVGELVDVGRPVMALPVGNRLAVRQHVRGLVARAARQELAAGDALNQADAPSRAADPPLRDELAGAEPPDGAARRRRGSLFGEGASIGRSRIVAAREVA